MQQLNRYYRRSKISERKMRQIIKYFALDLTASKTSEIVAVTRPSVSRIFVKIRIRIAEEAERASPFGGTVEVDEVISVPSVCAASVDAVPRVK